jgi:hypothetical protein
MLCAATLEFRSDDAVRGKSLRGSTGRRNLNANESEAKRHETSCFDRVGVVHVHGRDRVRLRAE